MTVAELEAALIATGLDPQLAALAAAIAAARQSGTLVHVDGLLLKPAAAQLLRERVSAVENQFKKQLITDAQAIAALNDLEIPAANRDALLATWAALKTKPTTTGEKLPR